MMHRRTCLGLGLAGLVGPTRAWAAEVHFRFHLPDGFKAPNEVTTPEGVVPETALADAAGLDAFGVSMAGGELVARFGATEQAGSVHFPTSLSDVRTIIEVTPKLKGTTAISCERRVIANAKCSRFELDLTGPDDEWRQLVYLVPGGDSWASLHVASRHAHYDRFARQLDEVVAALPGIAEFTRKPRLPTDEERTQELAGAIGGGAVVGLLVRWLLFGKKKPRKRRQANVAA